MSRYDEQLEKEIDSLLRLFKSKNIEDKDDKDTLDASKCKNKKE